MNSESFDHRFIFAIPKETFALLRTAVKKEGKTIRAVLLNLIDGYLNADAKSKTLKNDVAALARRVARLEEKAGIEADDQNDGVRLT